MILQLLEHTPIYLSFPYQVTVTAAVEDFQSLRLFCNDRLHYAMAQQYLFLWNDNYSCASPSWWAALRNWRYFVIEDRVVLMQQRAEAENRWSHAKASWGANICPSLASAASLWMSSQAWHFVHLYWPANLKQRIENSVTSRCASIRYASRIDRKSCESSRYPKYYIISMLYRIERRWILRQGLAGQHITR